MSFILSYHFGINQMRRFICILLILPAFAMANSLQLCLIAWNTPSQSLTPIEKIDFINTQNWIDLNRDAVLETDPNTCPFLKKEASFQVKAHWEMNIEKDQTQGSMSNEDRTLYGRFVLKQSPFYDIQMGMIDTNSGWYIHQARRLRFDKVNVIDFKQYALLMFLSHEDIIQPEPQVQNENTIQVQNEQTPSIPQVQNESGPIHVQNEQTPSIPQVQNESGLNTLERPNKTNLLITRDHQDNTFAPQG